MSTFSFSPLIAGSGSGVTTYANFAALPGLATDGAVALTLDTDTLYAFNLGSTTWLAIGAPGLALAVGAIDSVGPSANGAVLNLDNLIMQSASNTNPGLVNTAAQTFAGVKTLTSPIFITPALGTPASGVATNLTGTASGLTAGNVTTNANLTGVITSVGNATSIASQTGTGTKFVVDNTPTLITPVIGAATGTSLQLSGLTPSFAVVTDGSKNLASLGYGFANTGSYLAQRDSNGNLAVNSLISTTISTVTSGQSIAMTGGSAQNQIATGSANITYRLPDATTLIAGWDFTFNNNSTGIITIKLNDNATTLCTVPYLGYMHILCLTNGTTNGTWDFHALLANGSISGNSGTTVPGAISANTLISTVSTGTAPLTVSSTTQVANLNAATAGSATTSTTATNATNVATTATNSTNATFYPTFVAANTSSNQGIDTATGITFNPSTNNLTTTTFTGALAGNATTASTVTTNANLTGPVTSVGNATSVTNLAITNAMIAAGTIDLTAKVTGILPIANGGTNSASVVSAPAATAWAGWDANKNFSAVNSITGYTTTATAAGTTTLLVGSNFQQFFTGSSTQTVLLPVASTLVLGQQFQIINNSTGIVTVQSSGANTIQAMVQNTILTLTCILTSGTGTASWNAVYSIGTIAAAVNPTIQKFTSSSGTYTTPAGVQYIQVEMSGGGGGGSGADTVTGGTGGTGGNTTFGSSLLTANGGTGGTGGSISAPGAGGTGGTASLGSGPIGLALSGGSGSGNGTTLQVPSGAGGTNALGGSSGAASNQGGGGIAGATNTGSGGCGGGGGGTTYAGAGGGAGGYLKAIITSPSATYSYAVGAAGTGGTSAGGAVGRAGGSGVIIVTEFYTNFSVVTSTSVSANTVLAGPASGAAATPNFRALVAADLPNAIQAITTTANVNAGSTFITADAAGGAYTITFPVPTGNTNQTYHIRKTTSDITVVTLAIATSGSFVENASTTSTTTLNTIGESLEIISNGTNYLVIRRVIPTYIGTILTLTPSAGFGTVSATDYRAYRIGNLLKVRGNFKCGTVAASTGSLAITTLTIDSAKLTSTANVQELGSIWVGRTGTEAAYADNATETLIGTVTYDGSTTNTVYFTWTSGSNTLLKKNGNSINNNDVVSFDFEAPISGWNY